MAKEKNYNPVQEAKKAEKQKQIKKQKANLQAQRNEKLARRNPNRIQRDIDSLKELEQSGSIRPHEKQRLQELEKDLAGVNKARAALGDKAPVFKPERRFDDDGSRGGRGGRGGFRGDRGGRGGILGKRTRDGQRKEDESSDTDADVRDIPMPRDTPPPIPRRYQQTQPQPEDEAPAELKKPTVVYEAAPERRDFLKEATKFMPASVAQKIKLAKGEGRLLEPEEFDKLKDEGYMDTSTTKLESETVAGQTAETDEELERFIKEQGTSAKDAAGQAVEAAIQEAEYDMMAAEVRGEIVTAGEEAEVAEKKLRHVEIEEVEDEDL
ncbi:hypothetical protein N0V83_006238 [Neocucurbitaria cava]|uniref:Wbp11/ELF5/Saf1 N-terminal domain-containing protein n=1 Tax=Neocucurbitaria cava TaxID=798079 RepID=A0A9W8Y7J7_9PLEO|nr:hypothetical protein N0V83_006238 [Neocucurbitaria cava]